MVIISISEGLVQVSSFKWINNISIVEPLFLDAQLNNTLLVVLLNIIRLCFSADLHEKET
jgi:cadmium resistance protein CadD (predicted permease)